MISYITDKQRADKLAEADAIMMRHKLKRLLRLAGSLMRQPQTLTEEHARSELYAMGGDDT